MILRKLEKIIRNLNFFFLIKLYGYFSYNCILYEHLIPAAGNPLSQHNVLCDTKSCIVHGEVDVNHNGKFRNREDHYG